MLAARITFPHFSVSAARAQTYPTRPLTLIVPFAPGGPSDVAGRIIAQRMSEILGQQVVVENLSGAGGTVGSVRVAKAMPDGYQFVLGNSGTHVWSQSLYKNPPTTRLLISRRLASLSKHHAR
jgi:tripartite-type tricarboxylate transporter receptor subunit TctC